MASIQIRKQGPEMAPAPLARAWDPYRMVESLLRWDPFREMEPLWNFTAPAATFAPAFEVKETAEAYLFKADLPGVSEKDLEVTLTGDRLTIMGKRHNEEEKKGERFYVYERSYGAFTRTFTLPAGVDAAHIFADMKDGVLTLQLPKVPEAQPKKIDVATGGAPAKPTAKA